MNFINYYTYIIICMLLCYCMYYADMKYKFLFICRNILKALMNNEKFINIPTPYNYKEALFILQRTTYQHDVSVILLICIYRT